MGKALEKVKDTTTEACRRAKIVEAAFEHLKEPLSKVEVDWALEKEKIKLEVAKARVELAEVKKEAMEKYKASLDFVTEKAQRVVDFCKSVEFFIDCWSFSQVAFKKGFDLGKVKCWSLIMDDHQGLDQTFLDDEGESEGEPFIDAAEVHLVKPVATSKPILADLVATFEPTPINLVAMSEPALLVPIIELDFSIATDPKEKVRN